MSRRDPEQRRITLIIIGGIAGTAGVQVLIAWVAHLYVFGCAQ